jgi:hypothetical protein
MQTDRLFHLFVLLSERGEAAVPLLSSTHFSGCGYHEETATPVGFEKKGVPCKKSEAACHKVVALAVIGKKGGTKFFQL